MRELDVRWGARGLLGARGQRRAARPAMPVPARLSREQRLQLLRDGVTILPGALQLDVAERTRALVEGAASSLEEKMKLGRSAELMGLYEDSGLR